MLRPMLAFTEWPAFLRRCARVSDRMRVGCAEKLQDRIQEQAYEDRISYCQKHRSVCAERADFPCGAVLFSSHQPGYQASAADAEQVGKRDVEHDHGQGDRRRRHHIGVAGSSDEIFR